MGWNLVRPVRHTGHQVVPDSANEVLNSDFTSLHAETWGVTAVDLVNQAAEIVQSIEEHAAETTARAQDLAQKAVEQLEIAGSRIRALESAQSALEERCRAANARAAEAEQMVRQSKAEIAAMEESLSGADRRARNAEARVIEAKKILSQVEDSIRNKLLSKGHPSMNRLAAVA